MDRRGLGTELPRDAHEVAMRLSKLSSAVLLLAARTAAADTGALTIDHPAVACLVAGKHPVIAARFAPAEQVARARVYFRGGGQQRWYYVEMAPAEGSFRGTLPKPT